MTLRASPAGGGEALGEPFFNLKAANHEVIGTSQMYASESSREVGIASVMENGPTRMIKDNS